MSGVALAEEYVAGKDHGAFKEVPDFGPIQDRGSRDFLVRLPTLLATSIQWLRHGQRRCQQMSTSSTCLLHGVALPKCMPVHFIRHVPWISWELHQVFFDTLVKEHKP